MSANVAADIRSYAAFVDASRTDRAIQVAADVATGLLIYALDHKRHTH